MPSHLGTDLDIENRQWMSVVTVIGVYTHITPSLKVRARVRVRLGLGLGIGLGIGLGLGLGLAQSVMREM